MDNQRQRMRVQPGIDLRPYFLTFDDLDGPIDWGAFYGNDNPVELEVGTGRGLFLLNASMKQPETNFFGIEIDFKEARYAARRFSKRKLPNVRMLGGDARAALKNFVPSGSLAAVHVYFPDPWWKRRHRQRRIFDGEFLVEVVRILKTGGLLHAWTDVEEYFGVMQDVVTNNGHFRELPPPEERPAEHDTDYHTNFERKKRQAGLPIFRARWELISK